MVRKKERSSDIPLTVEEPPFARKSKFEVYGEEMIDKRSNRAGIAGGSIFLPSG